MDLNHKDIVYDEKEDEYKIIEYIGSGGFSHVYKIRKKN